MFRDHLGPASTARNLILSLALLLAGSLAACSTPLLPASGTPGIDLSTPLPFTPQAVPETATGASTAAPATATPAPLQPTPDTSLPQMTIIDSAGNPVRLFVEIADTPDKQETGLMHRTTMAEDQGMLFVFSGETTIPFWMKDTLLPLSIAFIGSNGTIVDIQDMQPLDESLHTPAHPYTDALEVNQGYFTRHGIAVGNAVQLPPSTMPTIPDATP
jgi:uncharacterized membrane protein (UPF0127 family)